MRTSGVATKPAQKGRPPEGREKCRATNLNLDPALIQRAKKAARKDQISLSKWIEKLIRKEVRKG